ncbi:preprotein translocase subunit SecY [Pseudobacteriovorax antillogorgiicola]|uniref:Protein translocase subunit SecY n=1 Tax=Pseudobacteriovorax antillogorgiicola TaxID=1513793 RepID=A0A1Y6B5I3_9BACT|nr:preprotein translocase subunit SecY [Pseudobacteriovorax antillogorgiicola]TCS59381.1 protein translocase subunit secY/sec61 alpha [Pseudobacteriovorax antillogorgiicola]SME88773.1 protein translocase subunit secY/sec61 alpha [Pseudobacteriovorax antillogorgiicola]
MAQRTSSLQEMSLNHLQKKILFTLGFLALYRIGVHVPIPGVDAARLGEFFQSQGANAFGMINMFSGGALERFSIFALGVMPYISASIIAQLLTVVVPHLEALSKEGEAGRKKITQYTRYGTILLAVIQGFMIARTLSTAEFGGGSLVVDPGMGWLLFTALSLTAGTALVMWIGEQITERGVGNGISLIIFAGIVAGLPSVITNTYSKYNTAEMEALQIIILLVIVVVITAGVVFIEQGARQVPIQYAKRQVGKRVYGGQTSHLPIRVNTAGVIPPIFASSLLQIPVTAAQVLEGSPVANFLNTVFIPGGWLYNVVYLALIVFFAFFYTSIQFKPDDIAENLKKHGGYIPGIRPGAKTADFLGRVINRLTLTGAIYLAAICLVPSIITDRFNVQFYFGGTSLLIIVGVALETFRQIDAHRQSLRYEAFMKQGSPRRRGARR